MKIHSYLELSTAHVTKEVAEQLDKIVKKRAGRGWKNDADWQYWVVAERWSTYGWWVWANTEDGFEQLPASLQACFRYATDNGCRWILFDADADVDTNLPTYDW